MVILENIAIDIDIDMVVLENIDIDIDKGTLQNIDIDKILYRLEYGISNRACSSASTSASTFSTSTSTVSNGVSTVSTSIVLSV